MFTYYFEKMKQFYSQPKSEEPSVEELPDDELLSMERKSVGAIRQSDVNQLKHSSDTKPRGISYGSAASMAFDDAPFRSTTNDFRTTALK